MKRRCFLGSALVPVFYINGALANVQTGSREVLQSQNQTLRFYYDERFARARAMVDSVPAYSPAIPVRGDITPIWNKDLKQLVTAASVSLEGVTTESFYFCLQRLLPSSVPVKTVCRRLDQDLYAWSIESSLPYKLRNS